jgi:hypothetical protein
LLLVLVAVVLIAVGQWLSAHARETFIRVLHDRYKIDVQLKSMSVSLFPTVSISGDGLEMNNQDNSDPKLPPLISIRHFSASSSPLGLLRSPAHISRATFEGMQIETQAKHEQTDAHAPATTDPPGSPFVIDEVTANGTVLKVLPRDPQKQALIFDIYQLTLNGVRFDRPMHFRAELRNAEPPGMIHAAGDFGPWRRSDMGLTPVSGTYQFADANMAVFKGISGKLSSTGKFGGILQHIDVDGKTEIPDFVLLAGGHPVDLKTQFNATVDGVTGDTYLHPVHAEFLHSAVLAQGSIEGPITQKGKTVKVDATVENGRLEDMLWLATKSSRPAMTGQLSFNAKLEIPPGKVEVVNKLKLDGSFGLTATKFTKFSLQEKVDTLSAKGRGDPKETQGGDVVSDLHGHFALANGIVTLSNLSFHVPGVAVHLDGTYGLLNEAMDFRGTAALDAKPSQMTTGVKSFFLKALDPFVSKKGVGTLLRIRITGTQQHPSFGVDLKR